MSDQIIDRAVSGLKPIVFLFGLAMLILHFSYSPSGSPWDNVMQMIIQPSVVYPLAIMATIVLFIGPSPSFKDTLLGLTSALIAVLFLALFIYFLPKWGLLGWFLFGIPATLLFTRMIFSAGNKAIKNED